MICSYQDYNQLKVIQGSINFLTQNFSLSFAVLKNKIYRLMQFQKMFFVLLLRSVGRSVIITKIEKKQLLTLLNQQFNSIRSKLK
jgi:hypothetical protein